jgi:hypothetical protein
MNKWDVNQLVSIVAHAMKAVVLKSKVQGDFLKLTGRLKLEIQDNKHYLLNTVRPVIVAADLVRFGRNRGMPINAKIAEEMVFDARKVGKDSGGLDGLIATIEIVSLIESSQQNKKSQAIKAVKFHGFSYSEIISVSFMNFM